MPTYKVIYFDIAGKAETMRWLFSYGNIPFVDQRVTMEEWQKIKPSTPLGQLPVLEIDGVQIPQSTAIYRYLANLVGLDGKDAKENLAMDVAVDTLDDLSKLLVEIYHESDENKKKEKQQKLKERIPFFMDKFEERAKKNNGYIAVNRLSWADFVFVNLYENLVNHTGGEILGPYPNLQQLKKNVLSVESIKKWIKNRPVGTLRKMDYDLKQDL